MEKLVDELKALMPFKEKTDIGDIVLIVGQNPQIVFYALVTSITRDAQKKEEWWNIGLTFLSVPLQKVVWTLRTAQMTGKEIFTMGGEERFLMAVDLERDQLDIQSAKKTLYSQNKDGLRRIK